MRDLHVFAVELGNGTPQKVAELLDKITDGIDPSEIEKQLTKLPGKDVLAEITDALQARKNIDAYKEQDIGSQYEPGTRKLLFGKVDAWLDQCRDAAAGRPDAAESHQQPPRMLLVLAGPGMGKSVFSAAMKTKLLVRVARRGGEHDLVVVKHFFKVGQQRSQGRAMVLCLAQQLAERLEGFADVLKEVVKEHRDGSSLPSMLEVFTRFLAEPLSKMKQQGGRRVLILLDALDESDDNGSGWQPVVRMVGNDFRQQLPEWVSVLLTSRPEVEPYFKGWDPERIKASSVDNLDDIKLVVTRRLEKGGYVTPADLPAAVELITEKSEGQFIFLKYAFEELDEAKAEEPAGRWSVKQLESKLPAGSGVEAMYLYSMQRIGQVLGQDRPDLLKVLKEKLLPVLCALRDLLTVDQLALVTEESPQETDLLLRLVSHLFPRQMDGKVAPYHKSVLDWLEKKGHEFSVDASHGHLLLSGACHRAVMASWPSDGIGRGAGDGPADIQPYCLKHTVSHVCATGFPKASDQLDSLLANWGFLRAVVQAGHAGQALVSILGGAYFKGCLSEYGIDAFRWLGRYRHEFEESEGNDMYEVTLRGFREGNVPPSSHKLQEAYRHMHPDCSWIPWRTLGQQGNSWTPDLLTLKVG